MRTVIWGSLLAFLSACAHEQHSDLIIGPGPYCLTVSGKKAEDLASGTTSVEKSRLDIHFKGRPSEAARTLRIWQSGVSQRWLVEVNQRPVGELRKFDTPLIHELTIPPGVLRDGENTLSIIPPKSKDAITIGEIRLDEHAPGDSRALAYLEIEVMDPESGKPVPSRITITALDGALLPVRPDPDQKLAVRPGVIYTPDGRAKVGVLPGSCKVYATRGFEYGLDSRELSTAAGEVKRVSLRIRREVATPGLVSSDTHIHSFAYSGHGDATADERMLTLAGEGIELPIATEHNQHTSYEEDAKRMKVRDIFTPVLGNEVTTTKGHFNAFPIRPGSKVPDAREEDWPRLMESIRSAGAKVIILNHPCDLHSNFRPFDEKNFNRVTGENKRGFEFSFDAMEVINSGALRTDYMENYRCWFAVLNYGYRVAGVSGSDCHDVTWRIVGQGRTYIVCDDKDPGKVDVDAACRSFLSGRVLASMGLLVDMKVNGSFGVGDLVNGSGDRLDVAVTVRGPSWSRPSRLELFANGRKIVEEAFSARDWKGEVTKAWSIPKPRHDVYLVAIATGPAETAPYWPIPKPYQPTSPEWQPLVIGSTNPVYVDADKDGKFTPPRAYAKALLDRHGTDLSTLISELGTYDEAVASQVASLLHGPGKPDRTPELLHRLESASENVRKGFSSYWETTSQIRR